MLKIFRIFRKKDNVTRYEYYEQAVVIAKDEESAKLIHPGTVQIKDPDDYYIYLYKNGQWLLHNVWQREGKRDYYEYVNEAWIPPEDVQVEYLGLPAEHLHEGQVICSEYTEC